MSDTTPDGPDPKDDAPKDDAPDSTTPDEETSTEKASTEKPSSARRPTAAASAASRARRIGGARSPAPAPAAAETGGAGQADSAAAEKSSPGDAPVSVTKSGPDADGPDTTPSADAERRAGVIEVPAWLRWAPAGVLSVCAIVMIVLILVAGHGVWYAKPSGSSLRDQVLAAAKTCTSAANTYSYQSLSKDEARGLACSTGEWSDQYRKAIKTIVTPAATRLKASQSIQINTAGIESVSPHGQQWTVVVFGQTKITQSGKKPRLDPFSAQVVMSHVDGKWLISKINTIVRPSG